MVRISRIDSRLENAYCLREVERGREEGRKGERAGEL
jgi:hypothetical protein